MLFGAKDKIELKVLGMTCGHCEAKIQKAVKSMPGVKDVLASTAEGTVTVIPEKGHPVDLEKVKEAIRSLGYQVLE